MMRASGNYDNPFKVLWGFIHGNLLSSNIFNILVDTAFRNWLTIVVEEAEGTEIFDLAV